MRKGVLFTILLLVSCAVLRAQEQEEDVAKALQTRNANLAPIMFQNKSFNSGGTFNGTGRAFVKSFFFIDRFRSSTFLTQQFLGTKNHWAGDFKFKTDAANLKSGSTIASAVKAYDTKTAETKTARESSKTSATNSYANAGEYRGRGRSQDRLDREGPKAVQGNAAIGLQGDMHPLTIAEVRELLNKNK